MADFSFRISPDVIIASYACSRLGQFASEAGKSKGQFYTPSEVSRIMAKIIGIGQSKQNIISIYDMTCGSGSLLL